jgi:hypothetical protein
MYKPQSMTPGLGLEPQSGSSGFIDFNILISFFDLSTFSKNLSIKIQEFILVV